MAARLVAAGNEVTLAVYPESPHSFTVFPTAMARRPLRPPRRGWRAGWPTDGRPGTRRDPGSPRGVMFGPARSWVRDDWAGKADRPRERKGHGVRAVGGLAVSIDVADRRGPYSAVRSASPRAAPAPPAGDGRCAGRRLARPDRPPGPPGAGGGGVPGRLDLHRRGRGRTAGQATLSDGTLHAVVAASTSGTRPTPSTSSPSRSAGRGGDGARRLPAEHRPGRPGRGDAAGHHRSRLALLRRLPHPGRGARRAVADDPSGPSTEFRVSATGPISPAGQPVHGERHRSSDHLRRLHLVGRHQLDPGPELDRRPEPAGGPSGRRGHHVARFPVERDGRHHGLALGGRRRVPRTGPGVPERMELHRRRGGHPGRGAGPDGR